MEWPDFAGVIRSIHVRLPGDLHEYVAARAWLTSTSLNQVLMAAAAQARQLDADAEETVRRYREHQARARAHPPLEQPPPPSSGEA